MKKLLLLGLLSFILLRANLFAQTQVPYQGIAINAAGQRLANQTIALRLSILSESATGTVVYVETQTTTINGTGAYTVQVGQGTTVTGTFAAINWMANAHFLKVEMDAAGGANYAFVSIGQVAANATVPASVWQCGGTITVSHVAGLVAPVSKTVTYGTVTNIPGDATKCWITSNLGADHQATSVDDATEASAGWYWQFNRKQGYKNDGFVVTPAWTINWINESSDWLSENDPCNLELGLGWHLPTWTEWQSVDGSGNWNNWIGPWNSGLKLHAAGFLVSGNGYNDGRGLNGNYWSSLQHNSEGLWGLVFNNSDSYISWFYKAYGLSVRCIKN